MSTTASRHALLLGMLAGCGSSTPLSPGAPPAVSQPTADAGCAADDANPGVEIVACGFAPTLSIVGVDDRAVYVLTTAGTIYRADKATGAHTKLYTFNDSSVSTDPEWDGVHLQGGSIYLNDSLGTSSVHTDILAIDAAATTQEAPRVVVDTGGYTPGLSPLVDSDQVYWGSIVDTQDGAYAGPLVAAPLSGGAAHPLTSINPSLGPLGIVDGKIYFFYQYDDSMPLALDRVATGGGDVETVVPALAPGVGGASTAIGSDALYVTSTPSGGDVSILRYPFSGGAPDVLYTALQGGEIPVGAPGDLLVDGNFLYFVSGGGTGGSLMRIQLDDGTLTELAPSLYAPGFDATYVYVAYTRGGYDGPIEGVIGRIAK